MTADSPSLNMARQQVTCTSGPLTPAQAIADAWERESTENREKWWQIEAAVKTRYNKPVRILDRKTKM
jgi:hypothetical protein